MPSSKAPEAPEGEPELALEASPSLGDERALVTIIVFTDFQCAICARASQMLHEVAERYPDDVRIVFKHFPMSYHKESRKASRAALAAGEQGKFWEMHDLLFENRSQFEVTSMRKLVESLAERLELDVERFKRDLRRDEFDAAIDRDLKLGRQLRVLGLPHFFINGERVKGLPSPERLDALVRTHRERARERVADGDDRRDLHDDLFASHYEDPWKTKPRTHPSPVARMIPVSEDDPVFGAEADFLSTVVVFADLQCRACDGLYETIARLREAYDDQVRFIFKHNPAPFEAHVPMPHRLVMAADRQDRFWDMYDLITAQPRSLPKPHELAVELGLDLPRFRSDLAELYRSEKVKADQRLAGELASPGTPMVFINGMQFLGSQSYRRLAQVLDEQIELAETLRERDGSTDGALYGVLVEENARSARSIAPPGEVTAEPAMDAHVDPRQLQGQGAFQRGPEDAPVTIVEFGDFQCPFSAHSAATIDQVMEAYPGQIRHVFINAPGSRHEWAEVAARAAIAAGRQGQFWEMYRRIYEHQDQLSNVHSLNEWARELGLDTDRFGEDLNDEKTGRQIDRDRRLRDRLDIRQTPTLFINGRRLNGAQPVERLQELIERELDSSARPRDARR